MTRILRGEVTDFLWCLGRGFCVGFDGIGALERAFSRSWRAVLGGCTATCLRRFLFI